MSSVLPTRMIPSCHYTAPNLVKNHIILIGNPLRLAINVRRICRDRLYHLFPCVLFLYAEEISFCTYESHWEA